MNTETKQLMKQQLLLQYPYLAVVNEKNTYKSSLTTAAKNIRIELKKAFPNIKFSVTTQRYAGGDSIDVLWTDGVTDKKVKDIIDKYQCGKFNGMEDIYEYNDNLFNDIFGAAMYVFAYRNVTPLLYSKAAQLLGWIISGILHDSGAYFKGLDYMQTETVYNKVREVNAD
jgi:hypothetical protein